MDTFFINDKGIKYWKDSETLTNENNRFTVNAGNNSLIQLQNNTTDSKQIIHSNNLNRDDLIQFIAELRGSMSELIDHLTNHELDELKSDLNYLEENLRKPDKNKSIVKAVSLKVYELLKGIPSQVISKLIFKYFTGEV